MGLRYGCISSVTEWTRRIGRRLGNDETVFYSFLFLSLVKMLSEPRRVDPRNRLLQQGISIAQVQAMVNFLVGHASKKLLNG